MVTIDIISSSFEGEFTERGAGEVKVAEGWHPWWHESDTRPEYKAATVAIDAHRIYEGSKAQQWFNTYATHTAGIYQQVTGLEAGRDLHFHAFVQAFTRNDDSNWRVSEGRYRMRIGVDPYGGTDAESEDVVWSVTVQPYDDYVPVVVETTTRSDRCTLFVWGQAEWALKHNNAYVDAVTLLYDDDLPPPPPPGPGGVTEERVRELIEEYHGW